METSVKWRARRSVAIAAFTIAASMLSCSGDPPKVAATKEVAQGLAALAQGKLEDAAKQFRKAIEHDPENKYAYYNLGFIDQTKHLDSSAEENYRRALRIDPSFVSALFNLAILRTAAGADDEAIQLYRRVIDVEPRNANAHLNLGFLYRSTGQEKAANNEFAIAVELDPTLKGRIPNTPDRSGD